MAILVKHAVSIVICMVVTYVCFQIFLYPVFTHETKAIIFRCQLVAFMECLVAIPSFILWRTLKILPSLLSNQIMNDSGNHSVEQSLSRRALILRRGSQNGLCSAIAGNGSECKQSVGSVHSHDLLWKLFLAIFIFLSHFSYLTNLFVLNAEAHWLGMLTYGCMGTLLQFTTGLLIVKCVSVLVKWMKIYIIRNKTSKSMVFSQKTIVGLTLSYTFCASMLGFYSAAQLPSVKRIYIPINNLSASLLDFRIIQLSDIHLGPTVGRTRLQQIVNVVNAENADLVVITGDLVDGSARKLKEAVSPLEYIHSKYGTLFVSGNHEYYTGDVDNWFKLLRSLGVKVLHSSSLKVPPKGQDQICFAGTDDLRADKIGYGNHTFDPVKAVDDCDKNEPIILLAHQPKAAQMALDKDLGIDVVLSGHTHAGQLFPMIIASYFGNPFFAGLYRYKGSYVYVSAGTQYWGIPMRLGTTMEITDITLKRSS